MDERPHAIAEGLVAGGVRHAVLSPGHRDAPLLIACARHSDLTCHVAIDERTAGFLALGLARARHEPVALVCTSGSALAQYVPAVVEAYHAGLTLVVCSADRPERLQDCGAPQTMRQREFFGAHVRVSRAFPEEASPGRLRAEVYGAVRDGCRGPAGPVHLNLPFDAPLVPIPEPPAMPNVRLVSAPTTAETDLVPLIQMLERSERPMLFAGPPFARSDDVTSWERLASVCRVSQIAVLADVCAPLRPFAFQRAGIWMGQLDVPTPDAMIWVDRVPTASQVGRVLKEHTGPVAHVHLGTQTLDPYRQTRPVRASVEQLADAIEAVTPRESGALDAWGAAEAKTEQAVVQVCEPDAAVLLEGAFVRAAFEQWQGPVFVGSSMPVRDAEVFATVQSEQQVWGQRGLNGIDGGIATALGLALGTGQRTLAVLGDVALAHDVGSLLNEAVADHVTVLVINNGGGRIFSHLPVSNEPEFPELFLTPSRLQLDRVAAAAGLEHRTVHDLETLRDSVRHAHQNGGTLLEVVVDGAETARSRAKWLEQQGVVGL